MNLDPNLFPIILISLGALSLILIGLVIHLEIKLSRLLRGKNAKTLEDTIVSTDNRVRRLEQSRAEVENYLKTVEIRLKKSVQGVDTIRFNAFKGNGEGGGQSFATALVNEKGDGVVISSMYSRDRMSIFAKPIKNLKSDFELTDEERSSLSQAKAKTGGREILN